MTPAHPPGEQTGHSGGRPPGPGRLTTGGTRWWPALVLGALVALQVLGLYTPSSGTGPQVPHLDKVAHALLFGGPVLVALLWRGLWWMAVAMVVHAPVSEFVQARLLPTRTGDPWDVVADITGIALAIGAFLAVRRTRR